MTVEEPDRSNDFGSVHSNSGIHNKAAYNLLTARRPNGVLEIVHVCRLAPFRRGAMFNLGVLLAERGESGEAETWYRRAAEAGSGAAAPTTPDPPPA